MNPCCCSIPTWRDFTKAGSNDAIRLTGFGVHANDFLALQEFLPLVELIARMLAFRNGSKRSTDRPGNWREMSTEFFLRTFSDVAITIQDAR